MKKYIRTYDNVLPMNLCKTLIDKFELSKDQQVKTDLKGHRHFTEINITEYSDWSNMTQGLYNALKPYIAKYKEDCKITNTQWPSKYGFEQIRFKKYEPNDKDEFKSHVDVGDHASARRFLVFFLYLNNNMAGETSFEEYDMKVTPERGKLLMFPPTWTYLHTGHKPIKTPKYIIGSYLHYL